MITWKSVPKNEYAQFNEVSTKGEVRRGDRILNQHIRNGYKAVSLYNPVTKKSLTVNVHRLVAMVYISNHNKRRFVNHINGNKTDNSVENLEWVTPKANSEHAIVTGLHKPNPKKVHQYTRDGIYVATFNSILEASAKTGANDRHISCVCRGKRKTTGGFIWKYDEDYKKVEIVEIEGIEIADYPNYMITKDGKVYSKRAKQYLKPKILSSGYKCVKLCNNGKMVDAYICKLVREYYGPPIQKEPSVLSQRGKPADGFGENSKV